MPESISSPARRIPSLKLHAGTGGICQRTENVEDSAETEFLSDCAHIFHGGVIFLGKEETDARFLKKPDALSGALFNIHAERLQAVSRSAFGGGSPVAVFCHLHATGGADQSGGGGNSVLFSCVPPQPARIRHIIKIGSRPFPTRMNKFSVLPDSLPEQYHLPHRYHG